MSNRTKAYDTWFNIKAGLVLGFIAMTAVACGIGYLT